jgi:hypothetical protein
MKIWVVQGLVLDCSALAWEPLDEFPPADEAAAASVRLPVWLALDEIEDPVSSPYSPRKTSTLLEMYRQSLYHWTCKAKYSACPLVIIVILRMACLCVGCFRAVVQEVTGECTMSVQQNMGAALRAAYFLGAAGVLTCARNSAPLSPAVSKASAGALEFMPVHACASMPRTLMQAAGQGWHVIGVLCRYCLLQVVPGDKGL